MSRKEHRSLSVSGAVHGSAFQFGGDVHGDVNIAMPMGVPWPVHVGVVPRQADCYQDRPANASLTSGLTVLTGMGGVGKTQAAAHHARTALRDPDVDLVVWITATSREAVLAGYAEAAVRLLVAPPDADTTSAATQLLSWLQSTPRRWLVVLDDLVDPAVLHGLWPPDSGTHQVLVTTRRRDSALARADSRIVDVTVFTGTESMSYLDAKLADRPGLRAGAADLADALGHLPLALAQAVAYLADRGLTCEAYVSRFRDQRKKLSALLPEPSGLPDDHQATVAVTWSLSIELADSLAPEGLARPVLQIASVLDTNGIPRAVLTSPPALALLAEVSGREAGSDDAVDALHCLHRLSLADLNEDSITVHALVQRATRDDMAADHLRTTSRVAADALFTVWSDHERDIVLVPALRANTSALIAVALPHLIQSECHGLLFAHGESLGESGLPGEARQHYRGLLDLALLGDDHEDTLTIRNNMARWQGEAGDVSGAVEEFTRLRDDNLRVLGADHALTLITRNNLATWRLHSGDVAGAALELENVIADQARVLGPDARETLLSRNNLASCRSEAGDIAAATREHERLLADRTRALGGDDPDTLVTRSNLASCKSAAMDDAGAVADYEQLLADQIRLLGPEHPWIFTTRNNLASARADAGSVDAAIAEFEQLLEDVSRILGPLHPHSLTTRANLAHWHAEAGDLAAAVEEMRQVLRDRTAVFGPVHPDTFAARHYLAGLRGESDDSAGAVHELRLLLADQTRVLGPEHPDTLSTRNTFAGTLSATGETTAAIGEFESLVRDMHRVLGADHPNTLATRNNLAESRHRAGDLQQALKEFRRLVKDHTRLFGADHPRTLVIRSNLAGVLGQVSQFTKAVGFCERLLRDQLRVLGPEHPETLGTRRQLADYRIEAGDVGGAIEELEALLTALARVLAPSHDRIVRARREIAYLRQRERSGRTSVDPVVSYAPPGRRHPDSGLQGW